MILSSFESVGIIPLYESASDAEIWISPNLAFEKLSYFFVCFMGLSIMVSTNGNSHYE